MSNCVNIENTRNTKEVFNKFTLKFKNRKLEDEYYSKYEKSRKRMNIFLAITCLVLSIVMFIWINEIVKQINSEFDNSNVKVENLPGGVFNKLMNSTDINNFVHYKNMFLFNETKIKINSSDIDSYFANKNAVISINTDFLIPIKDNEILMSYLNSFFILQCMWMLCLGLGFIEMTILILSLVTKKVNLNIVYFCVLFIFFSFNFHIASGVVRVFYNNSSDPVFFIVAINLFLMNLILQKTRIGWLGISFTNLIGLAFEWLAFTTLFKSSYFLYSIIFYLSVYTLIRIVLIFVSYKNEFYMKKEYFLLKSLNYEKDYLMNFVDNMTQGFLSYNNKNILLRNKSMNKIIEEFKGSFGKVNQQVTTRVEKDFYTTRQLTKEYFMPRFLMTDPECAIDESKIILEKMFSYVSEINSELPEEIYKRIKTSITEGFNLDEFFSLMKGKKEEMNFNDFISLGILKIDNIDNYIVGKTYQVLFRIITHNYDDDYLEIMFSDVSKILLDEREKTLLNARSIYLSKIAHEFRNPLTSLIELSLNIKDEIQNLSSLEKYQSDDTKEIETKTATCISKSSQKILNSIDYSEKLYKTMIHFLKDFSVFSNLKFPCDKAKNGCENLVTCYQCGLARMCSRCSVCKFCEEKKTSLFDYKEVIDDAVQTFTSLCKHENKHVSITYSDDNNNERNNYKLSKFIKTNKELFNSAVFNLIFHSYKSAKTKTEIKIKISSENVDVNNYSTHFEILNEGFEIDTNFIKLLNRNERINFEDEIFINSNYNNNNPQSENNNEINSNSFNRNFELYISFSILKKLNSILRVELGKNCTIYSFTIDYTDDEIVLTKNNNNIKKASSLSLIKGFESYLNTFPKNSSESVVKSSRPIIKANPLNSFASIIQCNRINLKSNQNCSSPTLLRVNHVDASCKHIAAVLKGKMANDRISPSSHHHTKEFEDSFNFNYEKLGTINFELRLDEDLIFANNISEERDKGDQSIDHEHEIKIDIVEETSKLSSNFGKTFYSFEKGKRNFKILIVDDENLIRKSIVRNFKKMEKKNNTVTFQISETSNCFEALNIIYLNCLENKQFDFVIIDEFMPFMKGSTLIKLFKQLYNENNFYKLTFISHTAFDTDEKKKYIFENGADLLLSKPVEYREFEDFIFKLM